MGRVRRKHSREFKFEAVKALRSKQHNTTELARRLGVNEADLRDWDKEYEKHGQRLRVPGRGFGVIERCVGQCRSICLQRSDVHLCARGVL